MTETYLVTGGAGFIGSNYVKMLCARTDSPRVVVLDALTYAGNLTSIDPEIKSGKAEFVHGSVCDRALLDSLLAEIRPDYIVHFAAESHVDRSISDPGAFIGTNISGTQTLLEAARQLRDAEIKAGGSPSLKKYIQVSTDEVYGQLNLDIPEGETDSELTAALGRRDDDPVVKYGTGTFSERTQLDPSSPYSASKASADMIALAYARTFGMPVCVTRCSNNYGPYQFPEKLIPLVINNLLGGRKLPVYGRGLNVRDWLHVSDHCRAIDAVIAKGVSGEVYNIGGFNEKRNIDLVKILIHTAADLLLNESGLRAASSASPDEITEDLISYVTDRAGHDARYAIDSSKIMEHTGWRPMVAFPDGIKDTVRWNIENRKWLDDVTSGEYRKYYERMYSHVHKSE